MDQSHNSDSESAVTEGDTPSTVGSSQGNPFAVDFGLGVASLFVGVFPPTLLDEELKKRRARYTGEEAKREREESWAKTTKIVQQYSDGMIKRWNAEIDTYLVFAGLLSAVITAFNVESYLLLQPATSDPTLLALQQISLQLSSFSTGPPPSFINSTHPAFQQGSTASPSIPRAAIWLNTLWFSSLILSLSSASVGIMIKQWLNEYIGGISSESETGTSRQTARLRQYRLNNLIKWHVGDIVNSIPVLLQVAVALFLAGLLVLLWTLHPTVAAVSTVLAGLLGVFTLSTVVLPSIKAGCAYLSPQSLAIYRLLRRGPSFVKTSIAQSLHPVVRYLFRRHHMMRTPLRRIAQAIVKWAPAKAPTWRGIEQSLVSAYSESLDADIICAAYDAAMNPDLLATAAVCLSELEPSIHVVTCIERLQEIDENHFGVTPSQHVCAVVGSTGPVIYDLWADSLLCRSTASGVQQAASDYRIYLHFDTPEMLPSDFIPEGVDRTLMALSIAACHNVGLTSNPRVTYGGLLAMQTILVRCNRSRVRLRTTRYVAMAAHALGMMEGPETQTASGFCMQITATNIILECTIVEAVSPFYIEYVLRRLTGRLEAANFEDMAISDHVWFGHSVVQLSALVNIVTDEPALPGVQVLFPPDRISALERVVIALQDAMRRFGRPENDYRVRTRDDDDDTLEEKLVRLRAMREAHGSSRRRRRRRNKSQSGPNVSPNVTSTSAPAEPPAASVSVERPTSVVIESPAPILVEPPTSSPTGESLPQVQDPVDKATSLPPPDELHASPRSSFHGGVEDGAPAPGPSV